MLRNEGKYYQMIEMFLQNGATGFLKPGWSEGLIKSLAENNLEDISISLKPSKLMNKIFLLQIYETVISLHYMI